MWMYDVVKKSVPTIKFSRAGFDTTNMDGKANLWPIHAQESQICFKENMELALMAHIHSRHYCTTIQVSATVSMQCRQ